MNEQPTNRPTKQVIVIRRDLRMRRGKEIAQGAHAASAWLAELVIHQLTSDGPADPVPALRGRTDLAVGPASVRSPSRWAPRTELMAVYDQALEAGLVVHLITDRGLTEFGGVPTRTCLAIGPDYDDLIDPVTGDLELY